MLVLSKNLRELALRHGWTVEKAKAYGDFAGYTFTAFEGAGFKAFALLVPEWPGTARTEIEDSLKKKNKRLEVLTDDRSLLVKFKESFRNAKPEEMENLLTDLSDLLRARGLPGAERCHLCGRENPEHLVMVGDLATRMHAECLDRAAQEAERARLEFEMEGKNYLTGTLGALLVGLIATIPWILVELFLERIAAILGYLIGAGAFRGYTLFKGKIGRATKWIVAGAALFSVFVAECAIIAILLLREGIPVRMEIVRLLFRNREFVGEWWRNLGLAGFMALLGIIPLFSQIKGVEQTAVPEITRPGGA